MLALVCTGINLYRNWFIQGLVCIRIGLYRVWFVQGLVCAGIGLGCQWFMMFLFTFVIMLSVVMLTVVAPFSRIAKYPVIEKLNIKM